MRTLVLLAAFIFVWPLSQAMAGHISGSQGHSNSGKSSLGDLDCGEGGIARLLNGLWEFSDELTVLPALPRFVLRDSTLAEVGTVVDTGSSTITTLLRLEDSLGALREVLLKVNATNFPQQPEDIPLFEDADYTSPAWFYPHPRFGPVIARATVIDGEFGERILFVATTHETEFVTVVAGLVNGVCGPNQLGGIPLEVPFSADLFPAEALVDDLHEMFPPPYTLEVR